jgi:hypothetical protein
MQICLDPPSPPRRAARRGVWDRPRIRRVLFRKNKIEHLRYEMLRNLTKTTLEEKKDKALKL